MEGNLAPFLPALLLIETGVVGFHVGACYMLLFCIVHTVRCRSLNTKYSAQQNALCFKISCIALFCKLIQNVPATKSPTY
jgi:hypothetical protein